MSLRRSRGPASRFRKTRLHRIVGRFAGEGPALPFGWAAPGVMAAATRSDVRHMGRLKALLALACAAASLAAGAPARAAEKKDERFAVHAQSTFTLQSVLPFHSAYEGPNSLPSHGQTRETFDLTLYAGVRLWDGAEIWANGEIDQGFGIGNTLGVAGFPSGEAYKVGRAHPYARLQRLFVRQTIGLGGQDETVAPDANQLGGSRRADRLVLTAGKVSVVDIFDTNAYAHDPRGDFLNWALIDTATFDYAAEAWGYTLGGAAELWKGPWTLRSGLFNLSKVPNGETPGVDFSQFQALGEIEHRHSLGGRKGAVRLGLWLNRGRFSSFADAIARSATSHIPPDPSLTRRMSTRTGAYLNAEQEAGEDLRLFVRAGIADGRIEPYDFTDVDRSFSAGGLLKGRAWGRAGDRIGLGVAVHGISAIHRRYLAAGGLGILVGDGRLDRYGTEQIAEAWYDLDLGKGHLTLDYQLVRHPAYNRDRGPAHVFSLRAHAAF